MTQLIQVTNLTEITTFEAFPQNIRKKDKLKVNWNSWNVH